VEGRARSSLGLPYRRRRQWAAMAQKERRMEDKGCLWCEDGYKGIRNLLKRDR
jgi:hypothetical protein